jgi:hypothetical protein
MSVKEPARDAKAPVADGRFTAKDKRVQPEMQTEDEVDAKVSPDRWAEGKEERDAIQDRVERAPTSDVLQELDKSARPEEVSAVSREAQPRKMSVKEPQKGTKTKANDYQVSATGTAGAASGVQLKRQMQGEDAEATEKAEQDVVSDFRAVGVGPSGRRRSRKKPKVMEMRQEGLPGTDQAVTVRALAQAVPQTIPSQVEVTDKKARGPFSSTVFFNRDI